MIDSSELMKLEQTVSRLEENYNKLKQIRPKIGFGLSIYIQRAIALSKEKTQKVSQEVVEPRFGQTSQGFTRFLNL